MAYSEEQLAQAGRQLAQTIQHLNSKIEALEGKPAVDAFTQQWHDGRAHAKSRGYSENDGTLNELEGWMETNGVARHDYAMQLSRIKPSNLVFGGLDERDLLFSDPDQWSERQIRKVVAGG